MKHCTSDTVCITLHQGVLCVLYRWLINVNSQFGGNWCYVYCTDG